MLPIGVVTDFPALYGTPKLIALIPTPHHPNAYHTFTPPSQNLSSLCEE